MAAGSEGSCASSGEDILDFSCKTKMTVGRCRFIWVIEHFTFYQQRFGERLVSSAFYTRSNSKIKWHLVCYPNGDTERHVGFLSIFLSPSVPGVTAKFRLSLLNESTGVKMYSQTAVKLFTDTCGFGYSQFLSRRQILNPRSGILQNDTLKILCELEASDVPSTKNEKNKVTNKLINDLKLLLGDPKFSDVVLSTCDKEFNVHKAILSARSPVFAAMFDHEMEENKSNVVKIVDADSQVMEQILHFIYTGECPQIKELAVDILPLAEKYNLDDLKFLCENVLSIQLTPANAVSTLILADLHSADKLKDITISYILSLGKEAVENCTWKAMVAAHPHLATQVYSAVFERNVVLERNSE